MLVFSRYSPQSFVLKGQEVQDYVRRRDRLPRLPQSIFLGLRHISVDRAGASSSTKKHMPVLSSYGRPGPGFLHCLASISEELKMWPEWRDSHSESTMVPLPFLKPIPQNILPSWVMEASCIGARTDTGHSQRK